MRQDSAGVGSIRTPDQRLRVFVSSTMAELANERRAASEAIRNLHLSPVLFEIGARPHPPRELYKAYLEQSDVFIGIYGEKYGWINPSSSISGIEDEYELSAHKPRLIYFRETQKREQRLAELLDRITTEGAVSYKRFSNAEELRHLIEDDLAVLLSERFQDVGAAQDISKAAVDHDASNEPQSRGPQVQYVTTADGVSIAHYAIGHGPAVMLLMLPFSHLEAEWQIDSLRTLYKSSARRSTFIRLDHRGFGLSEREVSDYSISSMILDIEAVVDRLGIEHFGIYANGFAAIPALAFTARHPDLVTHFVQEPPATSWADVVNERLVKLFEFRELDSELGTETIVRSFNPNAPEREIRDTANLITASIDRDCFRRFFADVQRWDAEADARTVSTPTTLIHRRNRNANITATRRVAGLIRDSRVTFVDASDFQTALLAQDLILGGDTQGQERETDQPSAPART